jgi:5-(carboxyamino)imidazole ribonucleotide mutase
MALKPLVGIIMGSDSDLPTMKEAAAVLEEFGVPYELRVTSAHRTPRAMAAYASSAQRRGIRVIIAGAGGAAHLPGMAASYTSLPVIGVPIRTASLDGLDSLLSIAQMPAGIPVATVAIGNARNAGLLAVRILATSRRELQKSLARAITAMARASLRKDLAVRKATAMKSASTTSTVGKSTGTTSTLRKSRTPSGRARKER